MLRQPWSQDEIQLLKNIYPNASIEEVRRQFAHRPMPSLHHKASRLGLRVQFRRYEGKSVELNESELAYLAGMIDGEGTITITSWQRPDGRIRYTPRLEIHNTHEGLVEYLQRLLKIAWKGERRNEHLIGYADKSGNKFGRKTVFCISMNGRKIEALLRKLLPYLVVKQAHALLVLEWLRLRRNHLSESYSAREIQIVGSIRKLNMK